MRTSRRRRRECGRERGGGIEGGEGREVRSKRKEEREMVTSERKGKKKE